jgi:hypothetical protein
VQVERHLRGIERDALHHPVLRSLRSVEREM